MGMERIMSYGHVWSHALNRLAHDHKKFFSSGYTTFIASLHTIVNYRISLKYSCVNSKFQSSQYIANWCPCKHASPRQSLMPTHRWPYSLIFFLRVLLIQAIEYHNTFITTNNDCPSSRVRLTASLFSVSSSLRRAPHHHRKEGSINERRRKKNPPQATAEEGQKRRWYHWRHQRERKHPRIRTDSNRNPDNLAYLCAFPVRVRGVRVSSHCSTNNCYSF